MHVVEAVHAVEAVYISMTINPSNVFCKIYITLVLALQKRFQNFKTCFERFERFERFDDMHLASASKRISVLSRHASSDLRFITTCIERSRFYHDMHQPNKNASTPFFVRLSVLLTVRRRKKEYCFPPATPFPCD